MKMRNLALFFSALLLVGFCVFYSLVLLYSKAEGGYNDAHYFNNKSESEILLYDYCKSDNPKSVFRLSPDSLYRIWLDTGLPCKDSLMIAVSRVYFGSKDWNPQVVCISSSDLHNNQLNIIYKNDSLLLELKPRYFFQKFY
jgi:hypothetical protein